MHLCGRGHGKIGGGPNTHCPPPIHHVAALSTTQRGDARAATAMLRRATELLREALPSLAADDEALRVAKRLRSALGDEAQTAA